MRGRIALGMVLLLVAAGAGAQEPLAWPRFRGPDGSGVADGQKPPVEFGPDKNVKWKVPVPSGLSSPIVAGNLLVLTAFEGGKLFTIAYRRADGKEAWRAEAPAKELEAFHKTEGSPAASSPATDGKRIVAYFGSCGLLCYDLTGKLLWKYLLPAGGPGGDFGSGVSPIIEDGTVVLVRDTRNGSKIVALDAATGARRWEKGRLSPVSYSTPVVWSTPNGKQVVVAGHARMIGYDLKTGEEKWFVAGTPSGCCSSPVVAGGTLYFAGGSLGGPDGGEMRLPSFDDMLKMLDADKDGVLSRKEAEAAFAGFFDNQDQNKDGQLTRDEWAVIEKFATEGKNNAFALKGGGSGDVTATHVLWRKTKGLPYVPSALAYRGQYVVVNDGGIVTVHDAATGNDVYQERLGAGISYYASPVAANGYLYFTALDGSVTVLKAGSDKPVVAARNAKLGERVAATPAIADHTLYIRGEKHLYAFGSK